MAGISRSEHHRREVSRVEGFSDAVFAFAITLLVVSLEVPRTFDELMAVIRGFPVFAVGFALVFQVWWRHYRFFRRYDLEDGTVIVLTGFLLFVVLFYVYPLKFLWTMFFASFTGGVHDDAMKMSDMPMLFEIYGLGVAAVFGILALLYRHAYRHRANLDLTAVQVIETRVDIYRNVAIAGIAIASVLTALILSRIAPGLVGIAGFMYALIGIAEWQLGEYSGRLRRRAGVAQAGSAH